MRAFGVAVAIAVGAAGSFALDTVAVAQPMMMDPSKMSGIPRPDPQVPPGTITVRLIRGQLSNRVVSHDVSLSSSDGKSQTVKTDAEGRATFSLSGTGPFIASAKDGDTELRSQPIEPQQQMGTRVMLVFPLSGAGAPDGVGHVDKALPAGTIVVRAEDAAGQGLEGLKVHLAHARAGEKAVEELDGKTDVAGEAKFEGQDRKPSSGYLVEVVGSDGTRFAGKPFKLEENAGSKVVIVVRATTKDSAQISIAEGSHFLVEVTDDSLQIIEMWRLHNASNAAFDPGPEGLHIPLPRNALSPQAPDGLPTFTINGHDAVWMGPLPPGDTQVRVGFVLAYKEDTLDFLQPTPIAFQRIALVTQRLDGFQVSGQNLKGEPREMQGRKLTVYFGDGTERGGELKFHFAGLPQADPLPRQLAAMVSIVLILVFGMYAAMGDGTRRARLERARRQTLAELVDVENELAEGSAGAAPGKALQQREQLTSKLAGIYRDLDDLGVG